MGIAKLGAVARAQQSSGPLAGVSELIRTIAVALITTVDDTGIVRTRQLPNTNTGSDDDLWFLAISGSPLMRDLQHHSDVLVTYAERSTDRFIVVNGAARIRSDPARVRALWHPVLASWLPGGPDDPALVLIQVQVEGVNLWGYGPDLATTPAASPSAAAASNA